MFHLSLKCFCCPQLGKLNLCLKDCTLFSRNHALFPELESSLSVLESSTCSLLGCLAPSALCFYSFGTWIDALSKLGCKLVPTNFNNTYLLGAYYRPNRILGVDTIAENKTSTKCRERCLKGSREQVNTQCETLTHSGSSRGTCKGGEHSRATR